MLKIDRSADSRVIKAILHRIADIPGGVGIKASLLGGTALKESTPIGPLNDGTGLYAVTKTAKIITNATNVATAYEVAKGHHFVVGDYFATAGANGQQITSIDKTTNTDKDVITVGTTLGVAITAPVVAFQSSGNNKTLKVTPTAVVGTNLDVDPTSNLMVDAWLFAVVKEANAVPVDTTVKNAATDVKYV